VGGIGCLPEGKIRPVNRMSKRWMAACRLHALSFDYTMEEIDGGSKSSQVLFPGLAHVRQSPEP